MSKLQIATILGAVVLLLGARGLAEESSPDGEEAVAPVEPDGAEAQPSETDEAPGEGEGDDPSEEGAEGSEAAEAPVEGAEGVEGAVEEAGPVDEEAAAIERARLRFQRGMQLVRLRHWEAALAEFDASMESRPNQSARFNRALCLRYLLRFRQAVDALEAYLEHVSPGSDVEREGRARQMLAEMQELLTEVTVEVSIAGALVTVDGQVEGTSPLEGPLLLASGPHAISVTREGYGEGRRSIVVVAGQPRTETFELEERRYGQLIVEANVSDADVYVDGDMVGAIPHRGLLLAGEHEVTVRADGYGEASRVVTVEPDEIARVSLSLNRRVRLHPAWFWSAVGLTAASALTTAGLGTAVAVLDSDYDPEGPAAPDDYEQGRGLMLGADVALGVGAAAAVGALVLYFFSDWPSADDEPAASSTAQTTRPSAAAWVPAVSSL